MSDVTVFHTDPSVQDPLRDADLVALAEIAPACLEALMELQYRRRDAGVKMVVKKESRP